MAKQRKVCPGIKIARGLRLLIEGSLELVEGFNEDIKRTKNYTLVEMAEKTSTDIDTYLTKAKGYSGSYIKSLSRLQTKYQTVKDRFEELTT